ncbi:MAG: proton-conducting transporter membrane subunit [Desulfocurvibacter africanus]
MHYQILVLLPLLFAAFFAAISPWLGRRLEFPAAVLALGISLWSAIQVLLQTLAHGPVTYLLGGWSPPWGISFVADTFSATMLCLMSGMALLNLLANREQIEREFPEKAHVFYTLYLLTTAGHLGILSTGDIFNLYVLIEVSALSGYALLSWGGARAQLASLNYLLIGSTGASFYLFGIGYLYVKTGSLNMADVASILSTMGGTPALAGAFAIIMLGLWIKMALFPFHGWLPGAYSQSTNVSASLLAPMTTKVMAYVVVRMLITVFPVDFVASMPELSTIAVWLASAAIVAGALAALAQRDLRRMLCFILVAEVGYMAGGAFIGNRTAMTGTMLHIIADALMTLTLFMAVSNIVSKRGSPAFGDLKGLFRSMPFTMAAFVLGAMSMIGVPPLCGFFSKWYLVSGSMQAGQYVFAGALILSSLINVILFFRIFEICFFEGGQEHGSHEHGHHEESVLDEVHWTRLVPLAAAALILIAVGLSTGYIVDRVIAAALTGSIA